MYGIQLLLTHQISSCQQGWKENVHHQTTMKEQKKLIQRNNVQMKDKLLMSMVRKSCYVLTRKHLYPRMSTEIDQLHQYEI